LVGFLLLIKDIFQEKQQTKPKLEWRVHNQPKPQLLLILNLSDDEKNVQEIHDSNQPIPPIQK